MIIASVSVSVRVIDNDSERVSVIVKAIAKA